MVSAESIHFYLQANQELGFGHLVRVVRLTQQLSRMGWKCVHFGRLDSRGAQIAERSGILVNRFGSTASQTMVIDSPQLSLGDEWHLKKYRDRIVISTTFRRMDLATHLLLRSPRTEERTSREMRADTRIDLRFGFAGIELRPRNGLELSELRIGICLSAGDSAGEWMIASHLLTQGLAESVHVLSTELPPPSLASHPKLWSSYPVPRPWDFFQDINVFLGGHGVMLSESILQGIPTVAFGTPAQLAKNQTMEDQGLLAGLDFGSDWKSGIGKILSDGNRLRQLSERSLSFAASNPSPALADEIAFIAKDER